MRQLTERSIKRNPIHINVKISINEALCPHEKQVRLTFCFKGKLIIYYLSLFILYSNRRLTKRYALYTPEPMFSVQKWMLKTDKKAFLIFFIGIIVNISKMRTYISIVMQSLHPLEIRSSFP